MARIDELKAQVRAIVRTVYSEPRDMSPGAIAERAKKLAAEAEESRGSIISAPPTNSSDG